MTSSLKPTSRRSAQADVDLRAVGRHALSLCAVVIPSLMRLRRGMVIADCKLLPNPALRRKAKCNF